MSTDLKERAGSDAESDSHSSDRIQAHYDKEFDHLTHPEHYGKSAPEAGTDSSGGSSDKESLSANDLYNKEANPAQKSADSPGSSGDSGSNKALDMGLNLVSASPLGRFAKLIGRNKRKSAGTVGATGGIIGIIVVFLAMIAPLKINHIVENLQSKAFASSTQAVSEETDNLLSSYIAHHVIPGYRAGGICRNTRVSKNCVAAISGNSPPAKLFEAWRQGKLENRLATEYGIEIGNANGKIYLKAPGITPNGISIDDLGSTAHPTIFDYPETKRANVRLAFHTAEQNMTKWDRALFKWKVGHLAQEKYGVRRCIIYCNLQDKFDAKVASKKVAFKSTVIERVIEPRSVNLASAMKCLMVSIQECDPTKRSVDESTKTDATNGGATSDYEREVRTNFNVSSSKFGSKKLDDMAKILEDIRLNHGGNFSSYLLTETLTKLGISELTSKAIGKAVPIIGWINFAAEAINALHDSGPKIKALTYSINSAAYVQMYMTYRTTADETKVINGHNHMDATELGSFVNSLGPGAQAGGRGAEAEATPLYNSLISDQSTKTALLDTIFPKAYAATSQATANNDSYTCDDGKTVPAGKLICPEEDLRHENTISAAASAASVAIPDAVSAISHLFTGTVGWLLNLLTGLPCQLALKPTCDAISSEVSKLMDQYAKPLMAWVVEHFFGTIITTDMSGGRAFTAAAGGSLVLGKETCQHQLGCQLVTPTQYAAAVNDRLQDEHDAFNHEPFMARMFDTSSQYSLVSRLAMEVPNNGSGLFSSGLLSLLSNPFGKLSEGFGSMFVTPRAHAAGAVTASTAIGVDLYAYPGGSIPKDPSKYWDDNCVDGTKTDAWNQEAIGNISPDTGEAQNKTTNPCLLIQSSVSSAGAIFSDTVLTEDDKNGSSSGATAPAPTSGTLPSGTAQELAQQILKNPNITFQTPGERTDFTQIAQTGAQNACGGSVPISSELLGVILAASQKYKIVVGVVAIGHDCNSGNHPKGKAADINGINPLSGSGGTGNMIGALDYSLPIVKQFYADVGALLAQTSGGGLGQTGCFPGGAPPQVSGVNYFPDSCDHIHMDVGTR